MRTLFAAMLLVAGVLICSIIAQTANARNPYNGYVNPYSRYSNSYSYRPYYGYHRYSYRNRNPYVDHAPRIYDYRGKYRGKLSDNRYDPDSISNPYGRYGNKYSTDSIHNPYIIGNDY